MVFHSRGLELQVHQFEFISKDGGIWFSGIAPPVLGSFCWAVGPAQTKFRVTWEQIGHKNVKSRMRKSILVQVAEGQISPG